MKAYNINKIFLVGAATLMLASCKDEMSVPGGMQEGQLTFSATMSDQDWYGVSASTRAAGRWGDELIPTNYVTKKGKRMNLISHEVNGIIGERTKMGEEGAETRAVMTNAIDTRMLSISQVGFTQGDGKNTYVELMNKPAVTTDGITWSCNEFFVNRKDYTAVRMFGALFPYSENYVIKTDDYMNEGHMVGSLPWLYQFRAEYELASDSAHLQEDLLYAKQMRTFTADQYATDGPTPLTFRHAMTAVKLKLGQTGFVPALIKEVRLKNVHNKGVLHFFDKYESQNEEEMVNTHGWWEVTDSKTTCVSLTDFDTQGEYNTYVTGDAATFMMIPQELPEDAVMEVDIVFNGDPMEEVFTISAPIGQHTADGHAKYWRIGTTHEYIIDTRENLDGYYMVMDGINQSERTKFVPAEGGEAGISLKSYKANDNGDGYAPLKWKYLGWSYTGDPMDWVAEDTEWLKLTLADGTPITPDMTGKGSITGEDIKIMINAMAAESGVSHADVLKSREPKGKVSDGAYDLSRHAFGTGELIGTTTANCYVIDAPGHYTFPTIYGNALVDGEANPQAYNQVGSIAMGNTVKKTSFVDYLDRTIVSPQIQYNTKLRRAELIWTDVEGMITDVKLTQRGDYVDFRVNREKIDQGNAVIAVYDEQNRIVWSWHIWVTDEDINATVSTGYGDYQAMPVNLGWKSVKNAKAVRGREIYLHFAQGDSDDDMAMYQTAVRITQRSDYKEDEGQNHDGSSPYYQWGRKDPMVGAYNGKSITAYTYGARSFYCESLTTWALPEFYAKLNKAIIFAATAAVGAVLTVSTAGVGTMVLAGALAAGAGAGANLGMTKLEEMWFSETDKWGATIGYSIQNPTCDIKSAMTWTECKTHAPYHDLWGIGQNTDDGSKKVVKTIYDPCPVGFHVPEGNAFNGLHRGYNNGLTNGKMYLPACGARIDYIHDQAMEGSFDIPLLQVGQACGYWTAAPSKEDDTDNQHDHESKRDSEGAFALVADKDHAGETKGSYEAWGYCIRPIKDTKVVEKEGW